MEDIYMSLPNFAVKSAWEVLMELPSWCEDPNAFCFLVCSTFSVKDIDI